MADYYDLLGVSRDADADTLTRSPDLRITKHPEFVCCWRDGHCRGVGASSRAVEIA